MKMERETRFELATPTMARLCSTPELFPQGFHAFCKLLKFHAFHKAKFKQAQIFAPFKTKAHAKALFRTVRQKRVKIKRNFTQKCFKSQGFS